MGVPSYFKAEEAPSALVHPLGPNYSQPPTKNKISPHIIATMQRSSSFGTILALSILVLLGANAQVEGDSATAGYITFL